MAKRRRAKTGYRDRVLRLERVRAGDLIANPANYRQHPAAQRSALTQAMEAIGIVDAVIAREVEGEYQILDGHLRADIDPEQVFPVLVVDLSEAEASAALATLDPLADMAELDVRAYEELPDGLKESIPDAAELWADMYDWAGLAEELNESADTGAHHSDLEGPGSEDPVGAMVSRAQTHREWTIHLPRDQWDETLAAVRLLMERWDLVGEPGLAIIRALEEAVASGN